MALQAATKKVVEDFTLSDEQLQKIVKEFVFELNEGLEKNGSTMSQIPTFVTAVPDGTEKGLYMAVDLGGTNFRVCSIQLNGDTTFNLVQSKVAVPPELMRAKTAQELFSFLAKQIELFLKTHHKDQFERHTRRRPTVSTPEGWRPQEVFRLGFTFSFPVNQVGINSGHLMRWTKGFDIADAVGKDVCDLLQKEIDALNLPVKVAALVNDTVGTLMARSYASPGKTGTLLGAIFGTGTNGAYVEKLSKITKPMEGDYDKSTGDMVINTEWGSFDNGLKTLPNTRYDIQLDEESINPGIQMFEKRISGMFLGELLRLALVSMGKDPAIPLFRDDNSSQNDYHSTASIEQNSPLHIKNAVDSSILSFSEADSSDGLRAVRQAIYKNLGVSAASIEDAQAVKDISHAIGLRAARLAGAAIGAIVIHTGRLNTGASSNPSPKSAASIVEDVKNLKFSAAASATANKLADTAGLTVNEDEIVDIGVDGSLVEFYPGFMDSMREALRSMPEIGAAGERRIRIGIAHDGSGVGAALIALVAAKMEAANDPDQMEDAKRKLRNLKSDQDKDETVKSA
ncbi:glucokinase [Cadophora gregata]|uniref:glucokinase n=1 Tax=Cadophora gregata TaxID=51156 RepID=UPI0026DD6E37|nr:glucokinase [Cadophora gregata]KAK0109881.1 glucokinase [Cadophora gregata]